MNSKTLRFLAAAAPLAAMLAIAPAAHAELEKCGGIFLSADASCEFHKAEDCTETCKTVSVDESCTAMLYTMCDSNCSMTETTDCTQTCAPTCQTECTATPMQTSDDICRSDCMSDCNTKCDSAASPECCKHACPYTCNKQCEDKCHDDDQMTDCAPKCTTACTGSCTSKSNTQCQVDCQTTQWEQCKTTTRQECTKSCTDKGGAIVCNGEFVDASDLKDCADELASAVSIDINVDVDVNATVKTVTKKADDAAKTTKTSVSCAFAPSTPAKGGLWFAALLGGSLFLRRRKNRDAR
ncbi:MAG TPA: hypothetical protein VH062_13070 [Polyangiaceae bacterium]|jgi:MYXO-CTERM domain-containing protein|nr:hypothetical protein [Polyangiaceae bacterium]